MKKQLLLSALAIVLFTLAQAQTGTIQLPATGQTVSYYPGDDGDLQKGVPLPANRFTDNGDGSCTDALTGLMWVTDGNLIASRDPSFDQDRTPGDGDINWKTAFDYIEKLNNENYLGYNDWRMPNLVEIRSLADLGRPDTALPQGHPFFNLNSPYWSSTTTETMRRAANCYYMIEYYVHANTTNVAGETEFYNKLPDLYYKQDRTLYWKFYLIPVRTSGNDGDVELPHTGQFYNFYPGDDGGLDEGTPWPSPRLVDNNDETVTDRLTGLMWTKDANLMLTRNPEFDTNQWVDGAINWQHALDYIALLNTENYLGYNDWRMPNRNEMTSLIDFGFDHPSLPERYPFTNTTGYNFEYYYWTSTTRADADDQAWMIETISGMMGGGNKLAYEKTRSLHVWPIRTDNNTLPSGKISGTITLDGNPYQLAQIELDGPIKSFIRSNLNGEYEFTNLPDGTYTVTPVHKYVRFDPLSYQVTLVGNTIICDFEATFKRAYGWTNISENLFPIGNAAGGILNDLYFIGNEGWIVNGYNFSEIYHTTDGGESWDVQEVLAPCNAVYMLSEEEGYAGGNGGFLHKTTDGGESWEFFGIAPSTIDAITFTDNGNVGYASGRDGWITKIIDGGLVPEKVSFPDFVSIAFTPSGDYGWAVACFSRKAIYEDGAWTYYGGAMYMPCLNDVQFVGENLMWLALDDGISRMKDNYSSMVLSDSSMFQGLFALNEDSVWAVGVHGDIALTSNGSDDTVHFSYDNVGDVWLADVFAVNANRAYAVGGNGVMYRYGILEGFPAGGANILDVVIDQQVSPAVIDNDAQTVWVEVEQGTDLTQLLPAIFVSAGATVDPPSGSIQDFTFPVTYSVTSENGQTVKDWVVTVTITTGVVEQTGAEFLIYPNPAKSKFKVQSLKFKVSGTSIEVFDLNGRKLLEKQIPIGTDKFNVDVSSLQSGLYMCRIRTENRSVTKKLIIQK